MIIIYTSLTNQNALFSSMFAWMVYRTLSCTSLPLSSRRFPILKNIEYKFICNINNTMYDDNNNDYEKICEKIVDNLKLCQINFLALDFDRTIITEHTGGRFTGTSAELAQYIRPLFRYLIPHAINRDIAVAVVTFSPQHAIICECLKVQFPDVYSRITVRCNDKTWDYTGSGSKEGKQPFMAHAAYEISTKYNIEITRRSTLLVDDDSRNIHYALRHKTPAVLFLPEDIDTTIQNLIDFKINLK